ncbi:MAG: hypothetical protein IH987_19080 [Planctomycetes bacterium]|nr:hypothetical protein [Planctomycetota bacterium]
MNTSKAMCVAIITVTSILLGLGLTTTSGPPAIGSAYDERADGGRMHQAQHPPSLLPVGSIIAFAGDLEGLKGTGWVLCDGHIIDESHPFGLQREYVSGHFWGKKVPDLTGRVPRGASPNETIGLHGGSDMLPELVTQAGAGHNHAFVHAHPLKGNTGWISNDGTDPQLREYKVRDDNSGFTNRHHLHVGGKDNNNEGHHYHELRGQTGEFGADSSEDGEHEHLVSGAPYVPSYTALHFIVRVGDGGEKGSDYLAYGLVPSTRE